MGATRIGATEKVVRQRRFLASGSFTVPAGVRVVTARLVGAGAAGNFAWQYAQSPEAPVSGVSGGCVIDAIVDVVPGTTMPVTVAPTTLATTYTGQLATTNLFYPGQNGASSQFGTVVAKGGIARAMESAGHGSGYGAQIPVNIVEAYSSPLFNAGHGLDFYGAGSGSYVRYANSTTQINTLPGDGGVRSGGVFIQTQGLGAIGYNGPDNSGAGGGSLSVGCGSGYTPGAMRAGHGGSGIVILEWEESV